MRNRRWLAILAVLISATLLLSACTSKSGGDKEQQNTTPPTTEQKPDPNKPRDGGTLTIGTFSDIVTVNPFAYDDTSSGDIINLIFAPLYGVNAKAEIVPDDWSVADQPYQVSADQKTYTAHIRKDAKFSDGSPLTAEDVAFTFRTFANKETASPSYASYATIKEVRVKDPQTVEIELSDVDARFVYALNTPIVPAKAFKDVKPADIQKHPYGTDLKQTITSGPYNFTEWVEKQYIKLDRNPNWFGKKANIQTINFKIYVDQNTEVQALLKGEVDFLETIPVAQLDAVKGVKGINIFEGSGPVYDYISFSFKDENFPSGKSPFHGAKTRMAIVHALNRKGMVDSVLKGHGTILNGPFLPGAWADSPEVTANFAYDVNKAKQLLAEDGWKPGSDGILVKDGVKFEFELMTNAGNKRRESYVAIAQQNLAEVGIKVNINAMDFSALVDNWVDPGKYQALLLGWQLGLDPDAESIFSSEFFPPAGQNGGWYVNKKTDELWKQGYKVADIAKRKEIYKGILQEFAQDPPYVFLATQNFMTAYNDRVKWAKEDQPVLAISYGYVFHIFNWWVTD